MELYDPLDKPYYPQGPIAYPWEWNWQPIGADVHGFELRCPRRYETGTPDQLFSLPSRVGELA